MNTLSKYKFWIGGAFCLVVIGLIIGALRPKHVSGAQPGASPDVEVVQVEQKDVPIFGEWIGTLDGFTNADVRAQVTGYLLRQGYREGAFVKKGQLLFEIDPRPFQAELDQAEGQLDSRCFTYIRTTSSPANVPVFLMSTVTVTEPFAKTWLELVRRLE
jgi:membrane fusion protein (multidrug efflux system)